MQTKRTRHSPPAAPTTLPPSPSLWRPAALAALALLAASCLVTLGGAAGLQRLASAGAGLAALHLPAVWVALALAVGAGGVAGAALARPAAARLPAVGVAVVAYAGLLYVAIVASAFSVVGAGPRATTLAVGAASAAAATLALVATLGTRPDAVAGATGDALVPAFRRVATGALVLGGAGWAVLLGGAAARARGLAGREAVLVLPTVGSAFWELALQAAALATAAVALWPPSARAGYGRARVAAVGLAAAAATMTLARALPPYGPGVGGALLSGGALCSAADAVLIAALGVRGARAADAARAALPQRVTAIVGIVIGALGMLAAATGQLAIATAQASDDGGAGDGRGGLTTLSLVAFAPQLVALAVACVSVSRAAWLARARVAATGLLAAAGGALLFQAQARERLAPAVTAGLALCVVGDLVALVAVGWGPDPERDGGVDVEVAVVEGGGGRGKGRA